MAYDVTSDVINGIFRTGPCYTCSEHVTRKNRRNGAILAVSKRVWFWRQRRFCSDECMAHWWMRGEALPPVTIPSELRDVACHHCLPVRPEEILIARGDRCTMELSAEGVVVLGHFGKVIRYVELPGLKTAGECEHCNGSRILGVAPDFFYCSPDDLRWQEHWSDQYDFDAPMFVSLCEQRGREKFFDPEALSRGHATLLASCVVEQRECANPLVLKEWLEAPKSRDELFASREGWQQVRQSA